MEKRLVLVSEDSVKEICRWREILAHTRALSAHDTEMLNMINLLDDTRKKWATCVGEKCCLKEDNESLQRENKNLQIELLATVDKLHESQAQISSLMITKKALEFEILEYKKRYQQIKETLRDNKMNDLLPFLKNERAEDSHSPPISRNSDTNTEEIDYDRTGDSFGDGQVEDILECIPPRFYPVHRQNVNSTVFKAESSKHVVKRSNGKRSAMRQKVTYPSNIVEEGETIFSDDENMCPTPPKRSRDQIRHYHRNAKQNNSGKVLFRRSVSESNVLKATKTMTLPASKGCTAITASNFDIRSPMVGFGNSWTRGRPIEKCVHNFVPTKVFFMGACAVCLRNFGVSCVKCNECGCKVHDECKFNAPDPCIPFVQTPSKNLKCKPRLVDFCPDSQPKIPGIIIRCVIALEKCHLQREGLYRIPGSETEVKKLLDAFYLNVPPNLNNRDPDVIAGCIKRFLRELREPLIPFSSYKEFLKAVEERNRGALLQAINDLPIPNRDTLAFLCSHWQNVAANSNKNQMPITNIAICFGPTISSSKTGSFQSSAVNVDQQLEYKRQQDILLSLLELDHNYWRSFFDVTAVEESSTPTMAYKITAPVSSRRPLREMDADRSILGPVTTSPTKQSSAANRQNLIERVSRRGGTGNASSNQLFEKPY